MYITVMYLCEILQNAFCEKQNLNYMQFLQATWHMPPSIMASASLYWQLMDAHS